MKSLLARLEIPRLSLRSACFLVTLIAGVIPMSVFALWPYSRALELEHGEVRQRHLLIAHNLGAALDRYQRDVAATFDHVINELQSGRIEASFAAILENLKFKHICLVDPKTGRVVSAAGLRPELLPVRLPPKLLVDLMSKSTTEKVSFSDVRIHVSGKPVIFVSRRIGDKLGIGAIETGYFKELSKSIMFGVNAHAAIVDHTGKVLAHPNPDWVAQAKNISNVSAVQDMMKGGTGVSIFYSPAFKEDMIAGFATVPYSGWGVMIPQPIAELRRKADSVRGYGLFVLVVGSLVAVMLAWLVSLPVVLPIQRLSRAVSDLGANGASPEPLVTSRLTPIEVDGLVTVFNDVREHLHIQQARTTERTAQLEEEIATRQQIEERIRHMALHDDLTGLPNRRMMTKRLAAALAMPASERKFALLSIDMNDFKAINDTLGHAAGDELLRQVAIRLQSCLRHGDFAARLGGDEFVAQSRVGGV